MSGPAPLPVIKTSQGPQVGPYIFGKTLGSGSTGKVKLVRFVFVLIPFDRASTSSMSFSLVLASERARSWLRIARKCASKDQR